ncbi:MAG: ROK family protein [Sphingomonadales bacterium]|uniref:ROK family protein n=1 Tax=Novosphingobium sp. NDB2Meth1 TaxID=1892847 RepID=UPI000930CB10|nr:ROK family protein [Novosphingobium sp. NDB2Meth1]MBU6395309.1 ROK family protein [Sphingomonadales bacterium]MBY0392154.1 ROK family protein [Novosphingobium sp.]
MSTARYGLIEAGGTKFVLGVADAERTIYARERIPTTTPAETLGSALEWFAAQGVDYAAFGIASFGPLDLDPASPAFGCVRATPKPHWSGASLIEPFLERFGVPVAIDTDVNGAALSEALWGAGAGLGSVLYLTIGTGIGGGFCSGGQLLQGLSHPEMGHIRMPRHPVDLDFAGTCPFHGDCLEGLACGPAVIARWGMSLSELPAGHLGKGIIAWYIGRALATFQTVMEPARIVLGGGVTATEGLLDLIRVEALAANGGYTVGKIDELIVPPGLGDNAGLLGALALALR